MKSKEEVENEQIKMSVGEKEIIRGFVAEFDQLLQDDTISTSVLQYLDNTIKGLLSFRENYSRKIINLVKQGHLID